MESRIDATGKHYKTLNQEIISGMNGGTTKLILDNVNGQRYIGDALEGNQEIIIHGVPGNDLAVFMNGLHITVYGNIQDGGANTMNEGTLVVHGSAGDTLGYGMRGGEIYIRDDVGYRAGIHMKEYGDDRPIIVIGGGAGNFLGEYMAGGLIILLNLEGRENCLGNYTGSGMHGGAIYVRGDIEKQRKKIKARIVPVQNAEAEELNHYIGRFSKYFDRNPGPVRPEEYFKIVGTGARPYKKLYVGV